MPFGGHTVLYCYIATCVRSQPPRPSYRRRQTAKEEEQEQKNSNENNNRPYMNTIGDLLQHLLVR
jgi:hypothetical protein